jgi:flagellin-like protein
MNMKKGISAVIGSILLVMITVAVVSAAYVFMNRAADTAANGTENKARETVQAVGNKFAIENVNKNVVYIRNLGTLEIGDPAFYVENSEVSHSGPASLLAGKVGTYLLDESVLDKFCGTVTLKVIVGPFSKKTTIDLSKNSVLLFKSQETRRCAEPLRRTWFPSHRLLMMKSGSWQPTKAMQL